MYRYKIWWRHIPIYNYKRSLMELRNTEFHYNLKSLLSHYSLKCTHHSIFW